MDQGGDWESAVVPAQECVGYRGVGPYLRASGEGDVVGQAPGVMYNK